MLYNTAAQLLQLGIDVPAAARAHGNSGALASLAERELGEIERLEGGRKPSLYPAPEGRGFDPDHFVRALCARHVTTVATSARSTGPTHRTCAGTAPPTAGLRPRRRAHDGAQPAVDVPRPRACTSTRCTGWATTSTATGSRALDGARHPPRLVALRRTDRPPRAPLGRCSSSTCRTATIVEDWMLFNEFDVHGPDPEGRPGTAACRDRHRPGHATPLLAGAASMQR